MKQPILSFPQVCVWGVLVACLPLLGCGGGAKMAPVSGTVEVDGQPMPDLVVSFIPSQVDGDAKGSSGRTDAQGRFTLKTSESNPKEGAAVGTHTVMIRPYTAARSEDDGPSEASQVELPAKATDGSLTFDVPAGGTTEANFKL